MAPSEIQAVAAEVESRLSTSAWQIPPRDAPPPDVVAASEVATFALKLSGRKRQASLGGRFKRVVTRFALAACLALASVAAACDKPDATQAELAETMRTLPVVSATDAVITQPARGSPARYDDMVLVDPGSDSQPWAVLMPKSGGDSPVLVDRVGADMSDVGTVYRLPAAPVAVGTRDGPSQFLDPQIGATPTSETEVSPSTAQIADKWREDERYLAATRAISGQPTVLDAAYNAQAAVDAGGTHTYKDGVVLRVDPDQPVLAVTDKALLESGRPTREEDVVYVAIRPGERSLYEPGQVVTLRDVAMSSEQTDVEGQPRTMYIANAALDGARVEPTGRVDLPSLLGQRLSRVDRDLAAQAQEGGAAPAGTAQPTPQATAGAPVVQQTVVNRGGSYVDDFLIWMWIANSGFFRGPGGVYSSPGRGGDVYYSPSTRSPSTTPSTVASSQAESRNTALQAARTSVSGQSAGTGGGVAASNKAAADATSRASAATSKAAVVAGGVAAASAGKNISSVPRTSSSTASRSAGSVSSGTRGSIGSSSSSSSSSSGGKGITGSSGGFGGSGATSGGSS